MDEAYTVVIGVHSKGLGYPDAPPVNPQDALTNNSPQVRISKLRCLLAYVVISASSIAGPRMRKA